MGLFSRQIGWMDAREIRTSGLLSCAPKYVDSKSASSSVHRDRCAHHTGLRHCMHTCTHTHNYHAHSTLLKICTHIISVHPAVPTYHQGLEFRYRQMEYEQILLQHGMNIQKATPITACGPVFNSYSMWQYNVIVSFRVSFILMERWNRLNEPSVSSASGRAEEKWSCGLHIQLVTRYKSVA